MKKRFFVRGAREQGASKQREKKRHLLFINKVSIL